MVAPVHDNSTLSSLAGVTANSATFSFTHVVGTGRNNYGFVTIIESNQGSANFVPTTTTAPSVSIGSAALTSLGSVIMGNLTNAGFIWVFGGENVPAGSQTVTATVTDTGQNFGGGYALAQTYTGVGSVGVLQTAFGTTTADTLSVPSAVGDTVWGMLANYSLGAYTSFSLTQRQVQSANAPSLIAGDTAGASSVTVSATESNSFAWGAVGLDLRPVIRNANNINQAITRCSTR